MGNSVYQTIKQNQRFPHRVPLEIPNGVIIVGGDAHYWPGPAPMMHRVLLHFIEKYRRKKELRAVIMNGDMIDFASISRWPLVNWEKQPEVLEEIETCQAYMDEIAKAAGQVPKLWTAGNHDLRFNLFLAGKAKEVRGILGTRLSDHFPIWQPCWSVLVNNNTFIKHRFKGGAMAVRTNIIQSGLHIITNHLHAANVWHETNMTGTRYGVDTGCIADPSGPQFLYLEDNPRSWREAFAILRYHDGHLLPPELVVKWEHEPDTVSYCGELIRL